MLEIFAIRWKFSTLNAYHKKKQKNAQRAEIYFTTCEQGLTQKKNAIFKIVDTSKY